MPGQSHRNESDHGLAHKAFVPQLATAQAVANSHRSALVVDGEALSYLELERCSSQVTHCLRSFGVRPDTVVGVCLDRSIAMVVSTLGVLKAGCAYLPLDPSYPIDRLTFMLEDSGSPLLLTTQRLAKSFRADKWQLVVVDEIQSSKYSITTATQPVGGDDLAYVIYTSGSTGRPKGVQITHASLLNLVLWHQQTFGVGPDDRATQLASPAFDAAVWEVWPYLTAGASVYLPSDAVRNEPMALRDWLVAHRITISFVPTPIAERMLRLSWPRDTALKVLLTGADTLQLYPPPGLPFTLVNNYGPTECTVVASSGAVTSSEGPDGLPSIGRPIANTQIYILDEKMRQFAAGATGEICIGGAGVARGYVNRPELTAEKFVPNPFRANADTCDRIYRTGDLGRYLPDGRIEFLGRVDDQIKIRGYRIEPGEIVATLNRHQDVEASHVVASDDAEKRLVAYVVLRPGARPKYRVLRDFVGKFLPDYMVPSIFVLLESFPVTSNGKINREKLPRPDATNMLQDEGVAVPATGLESRVAEILGSLLNVKQVGINDNFFLLGGHSLLGIQLIGRIKEIFGVELPLYRLFEAPTVAELSPEIERALFAKIEAMSGEEVERMLAAETTDEMKKS